MDNDHKQIISVAGFLLVDNKTLIVRRSMRETFLPGFYELPGGKVEFGEDPEAGLRREFIEEAGLRIEPKFPYKIFSYTSDDKLKHTVEIVYIVRMVESGEQMRLSPAHDEWKWITESDLDTIEALSPEMRANILDGFRAAERTTTKVQS
jgi:8-oxo-dGTP diphosphatase